MPPRKRSTRPVAPGRSTASRVLILLEDMEQKIQAVFEAIQASEARIIDRFELRLQKIELRLDALDLAVRKNSEDIRKNSEDIRKNSEDIRKNSEDIEALRVAVTRLEKVLRADADENAIVALERRVSLLESRVGVAS